MVKASCLYKQGINENRRLGFIKSLHIQQCCLQSCIRLLASTQVVFDFQSNLNGKNNLHCDEVRGDVLRQPNAAVK